MMRKKHHKQMMDQCTMWRTELGASDVDGYQYEDGDAADKDDEEEASQPLDGSTHNVED